MAIPDYQSVMLPLLKFLADGTEHSLREAIDSLADEFSLSEAERTEMLASGQQAIFNNRVGWARTYLKKAGLLSDHRPRKEGPRRSTKPDRRQLLGAVRGIRSVSEHPQGKDPLGGSCRRRHRSNSRGVTRICLPETSRRVGL